MTLREKVARAIWNRTFRHSSLMEWHELKPGQLHHQRTMEAADAALAAHKEWLAERGLVIVPREATRAMLDAGEYGIEDVDWEDSDGNWHQATDTNFKVVWQAMIAAAEESDGT